MCKAWGSYKKGPSPLEMRQACGEGREAALEGWAATCKVTCEPAGPVGVPLWRPLFVFSARVIQAARGPGSSHSELWRPGGQVASLVFYQLAQGSASSSRQEPALERGREGRPRPTCRPCSVFLIFLHRPTPGPGLQVSQTRQLDGDPCLTLKKPLRSISTETTTTHPPGSTTQPTAPHKHDSLPPKATGLLLTQQLPACKTYTPINNPRAHNWPRASLHTSAQECHTTSLKPRHAQHPPHACLVR